MYLKLLCERKSVQCHFGGPHRSDGDVPEDSVSEDMGTMAQHRSENDTSDFCPRDV